jgi:5-methylthioadenosine/S-adenosylhomocysteine deaminase
MTHFQTGPVSHLPGLTNAHLHGTYGAQHRGIRASNSFELGSVNLMARETHPPSPTELYACALVTGLENLEAGTTGVIDHYYGPLTEDHVFAVAHAYDRLGIRAWVLLEFTDLPWLCYTRESYPNVSDAVPRDRLPEEIQSLIDTQPSAGPDDLAKAVSLIRTWSGDRVRLGLALGNPVWCTDQLIGDVARVATDLDVLLTTHVDESPLQRRISLEQWGITSVERLKRAGALSRRTVISHAAQVDADDIRTVADHNTTISHNPISNLKLRVGLAPVGDWLRGNVNVCLGCDSDAQNLFTVIKFVAALADLSGLREVTDTPEEMALLMASTNAWPLWRTSDVEADYMVFSEPLGPYAYAWDDPAKYITEVFIDESPALERARQAVADAGARDIVLSLRAEAVADTQIARAARLTNMMRRFVHDATRQGKRRI